MELDSLAFLASITLDDSTICEDGYENGVSGRESGNTLVETCVFARYCFTSFLHIIVDSITNSDSLDKSFRYSYIASLALP